MKTLTTFIALIAFIFIAHTNQAQNVNVSANTISVEINHEDDATVLQWNTSRETNTSYFMVQKSTDGSHFTTISTVKANGSSMKPRSYEFEDVTSTDEHASYRVVLVLMDGGQIAADFTTPAPSNQTEAIAVK